MCNQHGLLRDLKCIESRAVAAMRNVNSHSNFVHAFDNRNAKVRDSFVAPLRRAVADEISRVVSELRHALAQAAKEIDVLRSSKMLGVLKTEHDADLSRLLNVLEIGNAIDAHEVISVVGDKTVPASEVLQRALVSIRTTETDRLVKDIDRGADRKSVG